MKFIKSYWLPLVLTAAAMAYAYRLDARDGNLAWPLLLTGVIIAGAGFFGGSFFVSKFGAQHDHR